MITNGRLLFHRSINSLSSTSKAKMFTIKSYVGNITEIFSFLDSNVFLFNHKS